MSSDRSSLSDEMNVFPSTSIQRIHYDLGSRLGVHELLEARAQGLNFAPLPRSERAFLLRDVKFASVPVAIGIVLPAAVPSNSPGGNFALSSGVHRVVAVVGMIWKEDVRETLSVPVGFVRNEIVSTTCP